MMERIVSLANGSSSTLYGCIGCAVKDMIMSIFPENYFNYTAVSSELATRNIRRTFGGNNSRTEIAKRQCPFLIIQPTYSAMDMDGPMQGIPLTKNFDNLQYRVDKRYLFEVIRDKEYGYNLKFKMNRDRIEFDVTLTVDTLHQQLDIYRTIANQFLWDRSYAYRMALEAVIPKPMIAIMSKYCNMDIEENEEYIPILLNRFNRCSGYPITYKLRNASATDEWFMYYTHNVIMTFTDLNIESGNRTNMIDMNYNLTFRVTAEFNMPGVYFVDVNPDKILGIDITLKTKEYRNNHDAYFPLYTIRNLYSKYPAELDGMQLYGTTIFQTTAKPNQLEDRVDIKGVLDNDHIKAIRAHRAWNMNPNTIMKIFLLMNSKTLEYEKDYYIDWNRMELVVTKLDNAATYRIIMYFNYGTINEILNNTNYDRNFDVNKLKENDFSKGEINTEGITLVSSDETDSVASTNMYKEGTVPFSKRNGKDESAIELHESTTYDPDREPIPVNPDAILYKNDIILHSDADDYAHIAQRIKPSRDDKEYYEGTTIIESPEDGTPVQKLTPAYTEGSKFDVARESDDSDTKPYIKEDDQGIPVGDLNIVVNETDVENLIKANNSIPNPKKIPEEMKGIPVNKLNVVIDESTLDDLTNADLHNVKVSKKKH